MSAVDGLGRDDEWRHKNKKTPDAQRRGFFVISAVSASGQFLIGYYAWAQEDQELAFLILDLTVFEQPTQ